MALCPWNNAAKGVTEMEEKYSVLMSVYHRECPEYLRESLMSILTQTVKTDDLILVCDGPLTEELDWVIEEFEKEYPDVMRVHHLDCNQGLAAALNAGLVLCKHDLVARMDTDDLAMPDRCRLQLEKFREDPELTIVGGAVEEFEDSPDRITAHKSMPESHEQIREYARVRNPFNHPTVMYRKSAVLAVGGYPEEMLHEDYSLWAELLLAGARGYNLPQTLVRMRTGNDLYARRGGARYLIQGIKLRWKFYRMGLYSFGNLIYVTAGLTLVCLVPVDIRKGIYRLILRKE